MAESVGNETVEVIYATSEAQHVVELPFSPGLTAREAVARSGLLDRCPQIAAQSFVLGSFGKRIAPGRSLRRGDRVEICRPLVTDPRHMRRALAAHGAVMGKPQDAETGQRSEIEVGGPRPA